jgi:hypothetical protein
VSMSELTNTCPQWMQYQRREAMYNHYLSRWPSRRTPKLSGRAGRLDKGPRIAKMPARSAAALRSAFCPC